MWTRLTSVPNAVGEVLTLRLDVTAAGDGQLVNFRGQWNLLDSVAANQVIARIDDRAALAESSTMRKELERLQAELQAEQAAQLTAEIDRQSTRQFETMRLTWDIEASRLDVLNRAVELEAAKIELQQRAERLAFLEPLMPSGAVTKIQFSDEKLLHDRLVAQTNEMQKSIDESRKILNSAESKLGNLPPLEAADVAAALVPLQAAVSAQEARVEQLQLAVDSLQIRTSIAGVISVIHRWPGQYVRAGEPLFTIASDQSKAVISYVHPDQHTLPTVGAAVALRAKRPGVRPIQALVERVGPQVEMIPERQRQDPKVLEWGVPVRIALPPESAVIPGELIEVSFSG